MASSSYFTPTRSQVRSRRNLQQTTTSSMAGSRAPRNLVAARIASSPRHTYSQQSSIPPNHAARHRRNHLPRTVTPTGNSAGGPSWEDFDEDPYGTPFPRVNRSRAQFSDRSVVSTSYVEMDADMPMDELIEDNLSVQSMPPIRRDHMISHRRAKSGSINDWGDMSSNHRSSSSIDQLSAGHSHRRNQSMDWGNTELGQIGLHRRTHSDLSAGWADDVSSLGGVEDRPNGIGDIVRALKHRSKSRPSHLTAEERVLWESIQNALNVARNEQMSNKRALERLLQDAARREAQIERRLTATERQLMAVKGNSKSKSTSSHLEVQVRDLETTLKSRQADHEREVRAMQRVLAAMTEEREQETGKLKKDIERLTEKLESKDGYTDSTTSETSSFLEVQLAEAKDENQKLTEQINPLKAELENARDEITNLKYASLERRGIPRSQPMTPPRHGIGSSHSFDGESTASTEEVELLQRNLAETATSLENAKKIIASLEHANGSLAVDLRAKLKAKEQELQIAQTECADCKRRLDILATELRALQVKKGDSDRVQRGSSPQTRQYQDLVTLLEKSMSGLQSASVVHEASTAIGQPDLSNVDQIGAILSDTLNSLRAALEKAQSSPEQSKKESEITIDGEKISMKQMKDLLKKQHEQMKKLRKQLDEKNESLDSVKMMRSEINNLKEQCSANEKLIAKKDRELAVLRSSLPVDNSEGGYISDDDSGDEDENPSNTILSPPSLNYAAQENLSNILAQIGGNSSGDEVETLRYKLIKALGEKEVASKELKEEKESLANAKMIISSLENANKSMTADLRSRLQESNSEIATLVDKSKENEEAANMLREEVERLKKEKEELLASCQVQTHDTKETVQPHDESAVLKPEIEEKKEESVGEQV